MSDKKHIQLLCNYCGTDNEAYPSHDCIDVLQATVKRLTAERDAAIAETETFREVLVDNEAYGLQVIRERDALLQRAERAEAALIAIREWLWSGKMANAQRIGAPIVAPNNVADIVNAVFDAMPDPGEGR